MLSRSLGLIDGGVMETKRCSGCGEIKSVRLFTKRKANADGFNGQCKECLKDKGAEYRSKIIEKAKEYYKSTIDTKRCIMCGNVKNIGLFNRSKYRKDGLNSKCKECAKVVMADFYTKNPEKIKKYADKHKQYSLEYYFKNADKYAEYAKAYKFNNLDIFLKKQRENFKKYRDELADLYIKKALVQAGITTFTPEIIELKREQLTIHRLLKEAKNGIAGNRNKRTQNDEQEDNGRND